MGLSPWSVNHDTACDGHQGGIVTWCTQGDTFTRLTESGSLLWIHWKTTYILQPLRHYRR